MQESLLFRKGGKKIQINIFKETTLLIYPSHGEQMELLTSWCIINVLSFSQIREIFVATLILHKCVCGHVCV